MGPTFANAVASAGQTSNNNNGTSHEWSRRPNGATQTFRRPSGNISTSASTSAQQNDGPVSQSTPQRYVPPHRNGAMGEARYSKDQLLHLYKLHHDADGGLKDGLHGMYVGGWQPESANGTASAGWGRSAAAEQSRDTQHGPDICWDRDGSTEPLGLAEMDDEEREIFTTSVNTPLKPPTTKDGQQSNGVSGRKISISTQASTPGGYGPLSPTSTRGLGRRRETSESFQFPSNPLSSPTGTFNRDEPRATSPPPSLLRRRSDLKDVNKLSDRDVEGDDNHVSSPFGSLKRNPTGPLGGGFGTPSSPWANAPQSAGLSPMGSFGNFGLGQQSSSQSDKRPGLGAGRSESRFKNMLKKDGSDDVNTTTVERKTSMSGLSRVNENESWRPQQAQDRSEATLEEAIEDLPTGSAALNSDHDINPPHLRQSGFRGGFGTPSRQDSRDDFGFGAFGMTSDNAHGFGQQGMMPHQTPSDHQHQLGGHNEPMSPTDTNPYQSPEQRGVEHLADELGPDLPDIHSQLPGLGGYEQQPHQLLGSLGGLGALPNLGRSGIAQSASDRSQTSSVGPNRGFPGLGGLGGVSGAAAWPVSQGGLGTPSRQTANVFGGGLFGGSMADMQSPGLTGLGGNSGMFSPQAQGTMGGGGRIGSMFPPAMQDPMRQGGEQDVGGERPQFGGLGDASSFFSEDQERATEQPGQFGAPGQQPSPEQSRAQQHSTAPQQPNSSASNQPPAPQQRTMVMPDRMRWIYRDPQGQTQGPWSGLEMHDWYKAGFFSPELLVKKYEDPDYEPLAQLIRRIGNSREPFLVPQIGIPHGAASNNNNSAGPSNNIPGPSTAGSQQMTSSAGAQPPFASSFPSFGTTLTADQQNALERRKQEEQFLMARQKEYLAQSQIAQRMQQHHHPQQQGGLMPGAQLHHHNSTQSLHSQPSFGSMTSPNTGSAYQPSPNQGPQPGFFDNSFHPEQERLDHIREEEIPGLMDRLSLGGRQGQFGAPGQQPSSSFEHDRQVQQMMQDRARLQQEQEAAGYQPASERDTDERLRQFNQLRGEQQGVLDPRFLPAIAQQNKAAEPDSKELSLTEQVQAAASAQQSPVQPSSGLPQPFPPAKSDSPLPAPAAQRTGRTSVADQLQTDQQELQLNTLPTAETPSAAAPAPWAKEPVEGARGPSLKEIQAAEAKKAAEAEEIATAARRAALQREMQAQAQNAAVTAPAPGLPASASWGASGSPATPTGGANAAAVWTKAAQKPTGAVPAPAKSMAQIQKEEEARKKKLAAAAAATVTAQPVASPAGGKSYANLAGKAQGPAVAPGSGAWTTVGASGKAKTPLPQPAPPARAASSGIVPTAQTAVKKAPVRSATMAIGPGAVNAQEAFRSWAIGELRPDLDKSISAEDFVTSLSALGADAAIITEAVHGASKTIDSRHFAEEFVRRKRLADKGLVDTSASPQSAGAASAGGGWSEVAKKGPSQSLGQKAVESADSFRVVAGKKKGGKK